MDFDMPGEDDPRRLAVREWLAAHPEPTEIVEAKVKKPQGSKKKQNRRRRK